MEIVRGRDMHKTSAKQRRPGQSPEGFQDVGHGRKFFQIRGGVREEAEL